MSKITVTTIAGQTSGSDANKVKIESGDTLEVVSNATVGGTLGVGETTPLGKLHIKSGDSAVSSVNANANELVVENSDYTGISILGENESNIMFGDNEDPDVGRIEYHHSDNSMRLRTAATDKVVIASSGLAQFKSTGISAGNQVLQVIDDGATLFQIRAEDGNISFPQAGAGIYLGVTSGTASNLLNDYEEGTFTATLYGTTSGSGTNVTTTGSYIKVGKHVTIGAYFQNVNLSSMSGSMNITGIPFTTNGEASSINTGSVALYGFSFTGFVTPYIGNNSTTIDILDSRTGAA